MASYGIIELTRMVSLSSGIPTDRIFAVFIFTNGIFTICHFYEWH